ncbi:hypothetical protein KC19_4G168900 [Ceratodon purpureus]|uniref:Phosphatidic acid phosphatase type 2/haloperoxidase domain-containing protein n=1 Tax=Ceratodon purpureus TaxID=3225 RepID=A0A8T0I9C8_CERPU|nr:hypothetical protein KC19_4G168900 [Ceratodon purpureus]
MARRGVQFAVAMLHVALVLLACAPSAQGALPSDNISVQWNRLFQQIFCTGNGQRFEPSILQAHLNLAQWHALVALKHTGTCTTEEAVVAYASFTVLVNYFPASSESDIDPLLAKQIKALGLTKSQKKLAKSLGEAVAKRLIGTRQPLKEFLLEDIHNAVAARGGDHPGLWDYIPNTPHNVTAPLITHYYNLEQPFILPDPIEFVKQYLGHLKPPKVPSDEWDASYASLVDLGRIDWPGRTKAMNFTASLYYGCNKVNVTYTTAGCNVDLFWIQAAFDALPATTSLYDAVTLLAKMSVALHEAQLVIMVMKDGYYFWRPAQAFRTGDERHAPFPNWTPYAYTFFDPEFPSGMVGVTTAGATVLQSFFGENATVPFTVYGNGAFDLACPGSPGVVIPPRHYDSIQAAIEETILGRIYSGGHYNSSTRDGEIVGRTVAKYVLKHWAKRTPSGVQPDTEYLDVFVELPAKQQEFLPVHYEV